MANLRARLAGFWRTCALAAHFIRGMRAEVEVTGDREVSTASKDALDPYAILRQYVPDSGAVIVVRVANDGTVKGEWLGMTTEDAALSLYAAADAIVTTIPPRTHVLH